MNLVALFSPLKAEPKPPKQLISNMWEQRDSILQSDVNLFCWSRSVDPTISAYLKEILSNEGSPIRIHVQSDTLSNNMKIARKEWDQTTSSVSEPFWQDVHNITRDFLRFSEDGAGTLHIKIVSDNACSKFHVDGYRLRLFTTYLGAGTEWLPEKSINRAALGTTNERIIKNTSDVQCIGTGHVSILKGELANKKPSIKGIVHRSPEVSFSNEKRIILRIDI